jgi:hypothetical protein
MTDKHLADQPIPPEVDRWNWGAFLLNWIWGIGNQTYIALLALVPLVNLVMVFVLGAKGSAWAWRNGRWDSVEHFKRVQRNWAIAGAIVWLGAIVLGGGAVGGVFYLLKDSEAYKLGVTRLNASAAATAALGTPITTGFPFGNISISPAGGSAKLNFSATGPKGSGQVFLEAGRTTGAWSLNSLKLQLDGGRTIDILDERGI